MAELRRILRGAATDVAVWHVRWDADGWSERLGVLNDVRLPDRPPSQPDGALPDHVWRLVWNADPRAIDVRRDAALLAGRVLDVADPEAEAWALRVLPADAWEAAAQRGRSARQRAAARRMAQSSRG